MVEVLVAKPEPMVGRVGERAAVESALASVEAAGHRVLVVGGDAGSGKTTLVEHAQRLAVDRGWLVLTGECLDVAASVPFGPVLEALAAVARPKPAQGSARGETLEWLLDVLRKPAERRPVLLVLEDMQWADQSTRDFALTLARRAVGRVLLLVTFRTEDLPRGHPWRTCLTNLELTPGCLRMDLGPLSRGETTSLVRERSRRSLDDGTVAEIWRRSEGNPFFALELVDASEQPRYAGDDLPVRLSDLLVASIDALSAPTRRVLRLAAVSGVRVDSQRLGSVAGVSVPLLERALREATERNVLVRRGANLEFRHGLLQEAVYADLLPGERTRLHGAFAAALQQEVDDVAGCTDLEAVTLLAHHSRAAGDLPTALSASVRAGELALDHGVPEAGRHLRQALTLWDRVADAASVAAHPRADVLRLAARAAFSAGAPEEMHQLLRAAVAALGPDVDRLSTSRVYAVVAEIGPYADVGISRREAAQRAVDLADGSPTRALGDALNVQALVEGAEFRFGGSLRSAERAEQIADEVGNPTARAQALSHRAVALLWLGHPEQGLAARQSAIGLLERTDAVNELLRARAARAWTLAQLGRPAEALAEAREAGDAAAREGLPWAHYYSLDQEAGIQSFRGELDEAQRLVDRMREESLWDVRWQLNAADLAWGRGDAGGAARLLRAFQTTNHGWPYGVSVIDSMTFEADILCGTDAAAGLRYVDRAMDTVGGTDSPLLLVTAARCGYRAAVVAGEAGEPAPPGIRDRAAAMLAQAEAADWRPLLDSWWDVLRLTARAYARRLAGEADPDAWLRVRSGWQRLGYEHLALRESPRHVQDLLAAGRREEARQVTAEAWLAAGRQGARLVTRQLTAVARTARITLPDDTQPPSVLDPLTTREREVLALVADGATNRQIARKLVISEKTVSVHVSHLLAKLGAANRGEAAAVAHRAQPS